MTKNTIITELTIEAYTLPPPEVGFLVCRRKGNRHYPIEEDGQFD